MFSSIFFFLLSAPLQAGPVREVLSVDDGPLALVWESLQATEVPSKGSSLRYAHCKLKVKIGGFAVPDKVSRIQMFEKAEHYIDERTPQQGCAGWASEVAGPLSQALVQTRLLNAEFRPSTDADETLEDFVPSCYYNDLNVYYLPSDGDTWVISRFAHVKRPVACP